MSQKQLFIDIETVSQVHQFTDLDTPWQELWTNKIRYQLDKDKDIGPAELYSDKAAIYAEFGKIVCISLGIQDEDQFRVKSLLGDEIQILEQFVGIISKSYSDARNVVFVGHNIKEFDIPYICRRMVVHQIQIPPSLELSGRKPWEVNHIHDTLEMWKFGDYKNYTSLDLLANCLQLPTSKSDISGKDVGRVYWEEKDIDRISRYCQLDVYLTARIYRRLRYEPDISVEKVIFL